METAARKTYAELSTLQAAEPFPTATHQGITGCLFTEISVYLKAREPQCRSMAAPFAIFLKNPEEICLQPDIVVVQDEGKLDDEGCHGAPDWVVEVVSSSSRRLDYGQKLGIYINAGVREYWIVDPEKKLVTAYCFDCPDVPAIYRFGDIIKSSIYPDLIIDSSLLNQIQYKKAADMQDGAAEVPPDAITSPEEVKSYILDHFPDLVAARNKAQLTKTAVGALKGRADSRLVNEAVAELCK